MLSFSTSQEVLVGVLDFGPSRRRILPGLKQAWGNPWTPCGRQPAIVGGEAKHATELGLFIGLDNDIGGSDRVLQFDRALDSRCASSALIVRVRSDVGHRLPNFERPESPGRSNAF